MTCCNGHIFVPLNRFLLFKRMFCTHWTITCKTASFGNTHWVQLLLFSDTIHIPHGPVSITDFNSTTHPSFLVFFSYMLREIYRLGRICLFGTAIRQHIVCWGLMGGFASWVVLCKCTKNRVSLFGYFGKCFYKVASLIRTQLCVLNSSLYQPHGDSLNNMYSVQFSFIRLVPATFEVVYYS